MKKSKLHQVLAAVLTIAALAAGQRAWAQETYSIPKTFFSGLTCSLTPVSSDETYNYYTAGTVITLSPTDEHKIITEITPVTTLNPVIAANKRLATITMPAEDVTNGNVTQKEVYKVTLPKDITLSPSGFSEVYTLEGETYCLYDDAYSWYSLVAPFGYTITSATYDGDPASTSNSGSIGFYLKQMDAVVTAETTDHFGIGGGADGTENHPYVITTTDGLTLLTTYSSDQTSGKYFELGDDIEFDPDALTIDNDGDGTGDSNFTPIGNSSNPFAGKFYGNGHKITGLSINTDQDYAGLFGVVSGATLDGLVIEDASITAANYCGVLVGEVRGESILTSCSASGVVVSNDKNAGGLIGSCGGENVTISDCVSSAEVTAGEYTGGFVGFVTDLANISGCRADGYVSGNGNTGGFVGCIGGTGTVTITNCVARGDVRSTYNNYGGFIGWANGDFATISDCWCSGAVWGKAGNIGTFVGYSRKGNYSNCSVYLYGMGPRYFSGSQTNLTYDALTATQVADLSKDKDGTPWPAVKKHSHGVTPISTAEQLRAIANDATSFAGCYVLIDDIDLDGQTIEPIGNADTPFTGEFYGQGHRISDYKVETTNQYAGLFGNIKGGRVSGVLAYGNVSRTQDTNVTVGVGGFAGIIQSKSMVDDCSFEGEVSNETDGNTGGFVGRTDDSPVILRCCVPDIWVVDNSDNPNTGGFVGNHSHGYIMDAYAFGQVKGYANCVGGFAGYVGTAARVANAWCSASVENQNAYLGVFVGQVFGTGTGSITISDNPIVTKEFNLITDSYYDTAQYGDYMHAAGTDVAGGSTDNVGNASLGNSITGLHFAEAHQSDFQGFDFVNTWTFAEYSDVPVFRRGQQHVTFDPAGGTCATESKDYAIGDAYYGTSTDNDRLPVPVRPGYSFLGWFDDLGIQVTDDSTVAFDTSRTLHARWTENVLELAADADNTTAIATASGTMFGRVTLTGRTLYKDGDWNTLCLPFAVPIAGSPLDADGVTVVELDGTHSDLTNGTLTLTFTTVYDGNTYTGDLEAGKPYLIKWARDTNAPTIAAPVFSNVTVSNTSANVSTADGNVTFKGTFSVLSKNTEDEHLLFLGTDNTLYYPGNDATTIQACTAYFEIVDGSAANIKRTVLNFGDDEATGVVSMEDVRGKMSDGWYDLSGRRIGGVPTAKGIYIVNGNKVVIK